MMLCLLLSAFCLSLSPNSCPAFLCSPCTAYKTRRAKNATPFCLHLSFSSSHPLCPPLSQCQSSPAPMKDRRGGAGFPFSIGCMSQSAVAVADPLHKKPQPPQQADTPSSFSTTNTTAATTQERGAGEESSEDKARSAAAASGVVTAGVQRLLRGIKTLFAAYDGEEEDEEEREIVIGYPTDVQHVGHIGWDGSNKVGGMGMVGAFSLPSSLSLRQLEIAMDPGAATTTCIN